MKCFFLKHFARLFADFDKPLNGTDPIWSSSEGSEFLDDAIRITDQPFTR